MTMYVFKGLGPWYRFMPTYGMELSLFFDDLQYILWFKEKKRLAPRTISKFIRFLFNFCKVWAFVCFNLCCHALQLLVPVSKGCYVCIPPSVLACHTPCLLQQNLLTLTWSHVFAIGSEAKLSFLNFLILVVDHICKQCKSSIFYFVHKIVLSLTWICFHPPWKYFPGSSEKILLWKFKINCQLLYKPCLTSFFFEED